VTYFYVLVYYTAPPVGKGRFGHLPYRTSRDIVDYPRWERAERLARAHLKVPDDHDFILFSAQYLRTEDETTDKPGAQPVSKGQQVAITFTPEERNSG